MIMRRLSTLSNVRIPGVRIDRADGVYLASHTQLCQCCFAAAFFSAFHIVLLDNSRTRIRLERICPAAPTADDRLGGDALPRLGSGGNR